MGGWGRYHLWVGGEWVDLMLFRARCRNRNKKNYLSILLTWSPSDKHNVDMKLWKAVKKMIKWKCHENPRQMMFCEKCFSFVKIYCSLKNYRRTSKGTRVRTWSLARSDLVFIYCHIKSLRQKNQVTIRPLDEMIYFCRMRENKREKIKFQRKNFTRSKLKNQK